MYPNKAVENSDRVKFDLARKRNHPKVFIFQTLFSPSTVFFVNKAPSDHVQIAIQEKMLLRILFGEILAWYNVLD